MRKPTFALLLLASAAALSAASVGATQAAFADEAELPGADTQFLAKAIVSGRDEVELSQLASKNAGQAEVKQFAEHMVKDHTATNDKLMGEAQRHKINTKGTYGTPPLDPSKQAQTAKQQLESLSGAQFDKFYMQHMIQDHTQAVALFGSGSV